MLENSFSHSSIETNASINQVPEKLGDLLDRVENQLGKLGLGLSGEAFDILRDMDEIAERITVLGEQGNPMKSELAQYASICETIKKGTGLLLREIGGIEALENERKKRMPDPAQWWWYLDRVQAERRGITFKRRAMISGIIVVIFSVLAVIYNLFFAPDPKVIAVMDARNSAEMQISKGDFDAAIAAIDQGLVKNPKSAELLTLKGVIYEAMGTPAASSPLYDQAEKILANHEDFMLTRAQDYLTLGKFDACIADMNVLLQTNPKSAKAYLLIGTAYEMKSDIDKALKAYDMSSQIGIEINDTLITAQARVKLGMLMQSAQMRTVETSVPVPTK